MRYVEIEPTSDEDVQQYLALQEARHVSLQSLATSDRKPAGLADAVPTGPGDRGRIDYALRLWATNPYDEGWTLGQPLIWWIRPGGREALAVVVLPAMATGGDEAADPWAHPWVLAILCRRDDRGVWVPLPGAAGAFRAPTHDDAERDSLTLHAVPQTWVARAMDESGRDTAILRTLACLTTMHRLAFGDPGPDDGAFGDAWATWREDARGKGGRSDREYVALAVRYFALVQSGSRNPTEELAKQTRKSPIAVRKAFTRARERDLLGEARIGRAGGKLTVEGMRVLADMLADDLI